MMFYLHIRYQEDLSTMGGVALFLKWNIEDPVSDFERQRNEVIASAQGNRNPFIDNPYLATMIWGGDAAENFWE
jgi:endonuclease I